MNNQQYAVELRNISKVYPGSSKKANNDINLNLRKGEILCIAGENGAGKTTLMKILCGLEKPSAGTIFINGEPAAIHSPRYAKLLGIGMVHQHFKLFPEYTVAENIVMGDEPRKWGIFFDRAKAARLAQKLIQANNFSLDPQKQVQALSIGEMQQVEICRLLYQNVQIIILDEPTSALTDYEAASFFTTLKNLARAGKSLILITHKLKEIKLVSDRVAVLRKGELVGVRETAETDEHDISRMMMGREEGKGKRDARNRHGVKPCLLGNVGVGCREQVVVFDDVTVLKRGQKRPLLDGLSFVVHSGEILGFAGAPGNGLGALEAALGGFLHPMAGKILHRGRDISALSIRRLRNQGLSLIPADRLGVGSALAASVDENLAIGRRHELYRLGFLDKKLMQNFTRGIIERFSIEGAWENKAVNGSGKAASLSGGNLQKLILGREIDQYRDYIVFSEPTWGLDIAAADFVRGEIAALREKGAAVILISTNLEEALSLADRIIVMYRGKKAGEFTNAVSHSGLYEKIGACMQGLGKVKR
jgi:simple sugar transport system ATP-binding protein